MPPMNDKNLSLSPASQDLGLGAQLQTQLELQSEEAKKKAQQTAAMNKMGMSSAPAGFGGAATSLGLT